MEESSWIRKGAVFCAALLHFPHISASLTAEVLARSETRFRSLVSTEIERQESHLGFLGVHHRSRSGTRVQTPGAFTPHRVASNTTLPLARYSPISVACTPIEVVHDPNSLLSLQCYHHGGEATNATTSDSLCGKAPAKSAYTRADPKDGNCSSQGKSCRTTVPADPSTSTTCGSKARILRHYCLQHTYTIAQCGRCITTETRSEWNDTAAVE
jgi:hypothetical protein